MTDEDTTRHISLGALSEGTVAVSSDRLSPVPPGTIVRTLSDGMIDPSIVPASGEAETAIADERSARAAADARLEGLIGDGASSLEAYKAEVNRRLDDLSTGGGDGTVPLASKVEKIRSDVGIGYDETPSATVAGRLDALEGAVGVVPSGSTLADMVSSIEEEIGSDSDSHVENPSIRQRITALEHGFETQSAMVEQAVSDASSAATEASEATDAAAAASSAAGQASDDAARVSADMEYLREGMEASLDLQEDELETIRTFIGMDSPSSEDSVLARLVSLEDDLAEQKNPLAGGLAGGIADLGDRIESVSGNVYDLEVLVRGGNPSTDQPGLVSRVSVLESGLDDAVDSVEGIEESLNHETNPSENGLAGQIAGMQAGWGDSPSGPVEAGSMDWAKSRSAEWDAHVTTSGNPHGVTLSDLPPTESSDGSGSNNYDTAVFDDSVSNLKMNGADGDEYVATAHSNGYDVIDDGASYMRLGPIPNGEMKFVKFRVKDIMVGSEKITVLAVDGNSNNLSDTNDSGMGWRSDLSSLQAVLVPMSIEEDQDD